MLMFIVLITCVFAGWMGGCELSVHSSGRGHRRSTSGALREESILVGHQNLLRHKLKKRFLDFLSRALAEFWL